MQGLMEVYRLFPDERYLAAVRRIADLIIATFRDGAQEHREFQLLGRDGVGERHRTFRRPLFRICRGDKYLAFAEYTLAELERRPGTQILTRAALLNYDAARDRRIRRAESL